jgi:hypothetical protein
MRAPGWAVYVDTCVGASLLASTVSRDYGRFKRNVARASSPAVFSGAPHSLDLITAPLEIRPQLPSALVGRCAIGVSFVACDELPFDNLQIDAVAVRCDRAPDRRVITLPVPQYSFSYH